MRNGPFAILQRCWLTEGISGRSNAIEKVLARVAADQEGYYLLAYEPPPSTFYNVPDGALKLQ